MPVASVGLLWAVDSRQRRLQTIQTRRVYFSFAEEVEQRRPLVVTLYGKAARHPQSGDGGSGTSAPFKTQDFRYSDHTQQGFGPSPFGSRAKPIGYFPDTQWMRWLVRIGF